VTPTRRALLLGGAAGLLAACTRTPTAPRAAAVDPDAALRTAAVERERALLAAYDAVLAASPAALPRLGPLRAEHEAHLTALGVGTRAFPAGSATPSPSASAPASSPGPSPGAAGLVRLERAAAAAHAAATVTATPALAALLAQLAASESSHLVALA
jgi:hypothetical protein